MKEVDKRKPPSTRTTKRSGRTERRDPKVNQVSAGKTVNGKGTEQKDSHARRDPSDVVSDTNTGTDIAEDNGNLVIHYVDNVNRGEEVPQDLKANPMNSKANVDEVLDDHLSGVDKEAKQNKEEVSDCDTINDSASSQGDSSSTHEDEKVEKASSVPRIEAKKNSSDSSQGSREGSPSACSKSDTKVQTAKRSPSSDNGDLATSRNGSSNPEVAPKLSSESFEEVDKSAEEVKGSHILDGASNGAQSVDCDNGTVDTEDNGQEDEKDLELKIEEMEMRIEKLEEELREVAALELSLYSIVPEHGSSAHKVHTPARRISRLYIHACKHWTQGKRATIAKNTVSGLVLIAKSCGNDVPRLTFWLSNTVVLREIISQAFGTLRHSSPLTKLTESNGIAKRREAKVATLKWKSSPGNKQMNGFMQFADDWQETGTFTAALEKVESWIFSRMVESVWWQALTPNMQSPAENSSNGRITRLPGPALGDQKQGSFSVDLWRNAFHDALQRLCPVRAGGHKCGCLPILGRMVMGQCVARLDVAMFNAILRESAHEIPTDPVSDPILDPRVLPIPAGDLSFGSGAQLKNSVGNWSRWLSDMFDIDADDSLQGNHPGCEDDDRQSGDGEPKPFLLLNALSDLLMLPKDMLIDRSIRKEVCPSISLPLVKRILCNFTPDEFCPDPVPGAVLEALNAESIVERRLSGESARSFPYTAEPVVYTPPSSNDVAEKVSEAGGASQMERGVSAVQRKGYTSDEELEELNSPLTSIIDKLPASPTVIANANGKEEHTGHASTNVRYELLREVWSG